jgi:hypothetical protein
MYIYTLYIYDVVYRRLAHCLILYFVIFFSFALHGFCTVFNKALSCKEGERRRERERGFCMCPHTTVERVGERV